MNLIGVMAPGDDEPLGTFVDVSTALAWGFQQFKGKPFVVRVPSPEADQFTTVYPGFGEKTVMLERQSA